MTDETASRALNGTNLDDSHDAQKLPSSFVGKSSTSRSPGEAEELLRADSGDIQATTVSMDRSGAESINAERVTMDRSGAKSMETRSAHLTDSGVVMLKTENAVLQSSSAVIVSANEARVVKSTSLAIVAGNLTAEGTVKTLIQIGPSSGDVKSAMSLPVAVSFGAAFGLVVLFAGRIIKALSRGR